MLFIMTIDRIRNTVIAGHCCEELVISWELFLCNRIRRLLLQWKFMAAGVCDIADACVCVNEETYYPVQQCGLFMWF